MKLKTNDNKDVEESESQNNNFSYNEDEEQEEEYCEGNECGMCHDIPESIIYLSCEHIVCLVCAAKLILSTTESEEPNLSEIQCGLCGQVTELSPEVQETLIECFNDIQYSEDNENNNEEEEGKENESEKNSNESLINEEGDKNQNEEFKSEIEEEADNISNIEKSEESRIYYESNLNTLDKNLKEEVKSNRHDKNSKREISKDELSIKQASSKYDADVNTYNKNLITKEKKLPVSKCDKNIAKDNNIFTRKPKMSSEMHDSEVKSKEKNNYSFKNNDLKYSKKNRIETNETTNESKMGEGFNIYCSIHYNDEYSYYNLETKKLYCSQCLLSCVESREESENIRPIKKCLPNILQHFQDMLSEIQITQSFIQNKSKDLEIRKESYISHCSSVSKKFEFEINEFIEKLEEFKKKGIDSLETKTNTLIEELNDKQKGFNDKIRYFDSVINSVEKIKSQNYNSEEDIFKFFFKHQNQIIKELSTKDQIEFDNKQQTNFSRFSTTLNSEEKNILLSSLGDMKNYISDYLTKHKNEVPKIKQESKSDPFHCSVDKKNTFQIDSEDNKSTRFNIESKLSQLQQFKNSIFKSEKNEISFKDQISGKGDKYMVLSNPLPNSYRFSKSIDNQKYTRIMESSSNLKYENFNNFDENKSKQNFAKKSLFTKDLYKVNYNEEKKNEIERKLKLFDIKGRKEDTMNSTRTVTNFKLSANDPFNKYSLVANKKISEGYNHAYKGIDISKKRGSSQFSII